MQTLVNLFKTVASPVYIYDYVSRHFSFTPSTTGNSGSVTTSFYAYDANGIVTACANTATGTTNTQDVGFQGKAEKLPAFDTPCSVEQDTSITAQITIKTNPDILYYGYRYYSPDLGRWMSRDPIGEAGGMHLFCFVQNNPLSRWDYLGWACCDLGDVRNPKVGLTTVRTLGDPNVDKAADDIIAALEDAGTVSDIGDVLKIVAVHVASGGSLTATAIANSLLGKVGLSPDAAAKIAANLSEFYRERGKITQGVNLWTRVCYEECVGSFFSFLFGNSWKEKCDPWKQYQYIRGSVTIDWWASEEDAAEYMKRAYDKALDDFKRK